LIGEVQTCIVVKAWQKAGFQKDYGSKEGDEKGKVVTLKGGAEEGVFAFQI